MDVYSIKIDSISDSLNEKSIILLFDTFEIIRKYPMKFQVEKILVGRNELAMLARLQGIGPLRRTITFINNEYKIYGVYHRDEENNKCYIIVNLRK